MYNKGIYRDREGKWGRARSKDNICWSFLGKYSAENIFLSSIFTIELCYP